MSAPSPPPRGVFGGAAWRIGRVAGIDIAVDHSWLLIFVLITVSLGSQFAAQHQGWGPMLVWGSAVVTSLLFFTSIVLHELGHSLMAQRLGVGVESITLFVFGGVAQLRSEPRRPRDEILIAAAGPLVSIGLGLGFGALAGWLATPASGPLEAVLAWLGRINVMLAAFNCVPGFPLDGGRVLRGLVWAWSGSFERATTVAAAAGSFVAYTLIVLGIIAVLARGQLLSGLWLAFIGWFLLSAARATVGQVVIERILSRVRSDEAMESVEEACLSGGESVAELIGDAVLRRGLRTFYVIGSGGELRGLLTLRELAAVAPDQRERTRADQVMRAGEQLLVLRPDESAWQAMRRMGESGVNQLPVVARGHLLGAVTRERLLQLVQAGLAFQAARA